MSPTVRTLTVLRRLQRKPATIAELRTLVGNHCDKTIRRDLAAIRAAGFPLRERIGRRGAKSWQVCGLITRRETTMSETTKQLLTTEELELARQLGADWGHDEAECWRDQHEDGKTAPPWTAGTYCGHNPFGQVALDDEAEEAKRVEFDNEVDRAAEGAWNEAFGF